jgi:hypothetical protein
MEGAWLLIHMSLGCSGGDYEDHDNDDDICKMKKYYLYKWFL